MTRTASAGLDELRRRARLDELISVRVPLDRSGRLLMGLCPFHNEKTPSFCVYPDHFHCFGCGAHGDVFAWVMRDSGVSFPQAVDFVERWSGAKKARRPAAARGKSPRESSTSHTLNLAFKYWCEAIDTQGTAVERYLVSRGLACPSVAPLRFHPACPRGSERWPAMLALMTNPVTGRPSGVHRTFLTPAGTNKAPGQSKMMLGEAGVVRLTPDEEVTLGLGVTEGIETGLALIQRVNWQPIWAGCTAVGLANLPPLLGVECLTIFSDEDDRGAGLAAARRCAKRWKEAGREAIVRRPPAGQDWDDATSAGPTG